MEDFLSKKKSHQLDCCGIATQTSCQETNKK